MRWAENSQSVRQSQSVGFDSDAETHFVNDTDQRRLISIQFFRVYSTFVTEESLCLFMLNVFVSFGLTPAEVSNDGNGYHTITYLAWHIYGYIDTNNTYYSLWWLTTSGAQHVLLASRFFFFGKKMM